MGFALAKGLIRGLNRYPNPPLILVYYHKFRRLRGSPCSVTVDTVAAFDPEQLGVIEGSRLRRGGASLPHVASPNRDPVNLADRSVKPNKGRLTAYPKTGLFVQESVRTSPQYPVSRPSAKIGHESQRSSSAET